MFPSLENWKCSPSGMLPLSWDFCTRESWRGRLPGCVPERAQTPPPSASVSGGRSPAPSGGRKHN